jgi:hypothetical protein
LKATNISNETTKPACHECYDYCAPFACSASGWNTPTHIVTGAIAYRTLESESPRTVSVIETLLEKHPWDADRWRNNVEKLPESQRGEMLLMLAARWADDIRPQAKLQREVHAGTTSTFPSSRQASRRNQSIAARPGQYSRRALEQDCNRIAEQVL